MNPEQLEPSPFPTRALLLSNIKEGMGHNAERAQELKQELAQLRVFLHQESAETQAFREMKHCWPILLKRRWFIGLKYQSCHNYIFSMPKRSSPNLMRLGAFPLCWKDSKLSWRKTRNSRV